MDTIAYLSTGHARDLRRAPQAELRARAEHATAAEERFDGRPTAVETAAAPGAAGKTEP